jgi:hypothetical protein
MHLKMDLKIDFETHLINGSMTSPHKKNRKPHKKKSLQNAMTTSHEYGIITFKCDQNT